jgi:hypothetical protein
LPLGCLFNADARGQLSDTLEQVFSGPALAELDLGSDRVLGGGLQARLLLLPLEDEGESRLVLGVLGFAEPMPARCKLTVLACRKERLTLPAQETLLPTVQPIRRVGHLSLVHSAS